MGRRLADAAGYGNSPIPNAIGNVFRSIGGGAVLVKEYFPGNDDWETRFHAAPFDA